MFLLGDMKYFILESYFYRKGSLYIFTGFNFGSIAFYYEICRPNKFTSLHWLYEIEVGIHHNKKVLVRHVCLLETCLWFC